jgi:hypothetical protein
VIQIKKIRFAIQSDIVMLFKRKSFLNNKVAPVARRRPSLTKDITNLTDLSSSRMTKLSSQRQWLIGIQNSTSWWCTLVMSKSGMREFWIRKLAIKHAVDIRHTTSGAAAMVQSFRFRLTYSKCLQEEHAYWFTKEMIRYKY